MSWSSGQNGFPPYSASPGQRPLDNIDSSPNSQSDFQRAYFYPNFSQPTQPKDIPPAGRNRNSSLNVPQASHLRNGISLQRQASNQSYNNAAAHMHRFTGPHSAPSESAMHSINNHGISRFQNETEGPWVARTALPNVDFAQDTSPTSPTSFYFGSFRDIDPSETLSDTGNQPADSAYVSQTAATQSIYSAVGSNDLSESIDPHLESRLNFDETRTVASSIVSAEPQPKRHSRPVNRKYVLKKCKYCDEKPKCESDFKKHMLKHEKYFYCDIRGCRRAKEGFGTSNDLHRHQKSVHKLSSTRSVTKSFRCAAKGCEKVDKEWPRLDNFKQHVIRIHKAEHNDDDKVIANIVERSQVRPTQQHFEPPHPPPAIPMDEELLGMDTHLHAPEAPNEYTVSPGNLMGWPQGMDFQPSEEQGINLQLSPGLPRQEQLNKEGQTVQHPFASSLEQFDESADVINGYGTKPRAQALNTLADVAVKAPVLTVTEHNVPLPNNGQGGMQISDSTRHKSSSCSPARIEKGQLNGFVKQSLGSSTFDTETIKSVKVLEKLEANIKDEGVLDVLRRAREVLESKDGKRGRSMSNASVSSSHNEHGVQCPMCKKRLPRNCDMKKHVKRHTRPYGCTFPRCHKVFGSKNDWKRHENSQHFQQEMWRCQVQVPNSKTGDGKCGHVEYHASMFSLHLKVAHPNLTPEERDKKKQECRIGRSGNTRYWCGFCKEILAVNGLRGQAAWDERFNHIDEQHYKKEQRIDDWLCIKTKIKKGELLDGSKSQPSLDEVDSPDERDMPGDLSDDDVPGIGERPPPLRSPSDSPKQAHAGPHKEWHSGYAMERQFMEIYCCQCGEGPFNSLMLGSRCGTMGNGCNHDFCNSCIMSGPAYSQ